MTVSDEHMKSCPTCGSPVDGRILSLREAARYVREVEWDLTKLQRQVDNEEAALRKARAELARARKAAQMVTPPESEGR